MELNDYERSIEQIAAGLAHEVKNPLSLVRANIDLLELTDSEDLHKNNYMIMRREIEKINDLLLDFIQFAKPIENNLEVMDIIPVISELLDTVRLTYSKKIQFSLDCEGLGEGLLVFGDTSKIRRVLLNIIKNAVEAVDENGMIKLYVKRNGKYVEIICKDNGKGFDSEQLKKMSEPFFTTKQGGSGLGLFISKAIIDEHKGIFNISGESGKGCTVTIKIPRASVL